MKTLLIIALLLPTSLFAQQIDSLIAVGHEKLMIPPNERKVIAVKMTKMGGRYAHISKKGNGLLIKIDNPTWVTFDIYTKQALILHELAHRYLKRKHTLEKSLMNVEDQYIFEYQGNEEYFINELIN